MFEELISLHNSGILKNMVNRGFVSMKSVQYLEVCMWIDAKMKTEGINKTRAVERYADEYHVEVRYVWRACKAIF